MPKDYADQLIMESRNNVHFSDSYSRNMPCPNKGKLKPKNEWRDPARYEAKANLKHPECPSGMKGKVDMAVRESGMWTTIKCPECGYGESWAAGDGDELF